MGRNWVHSQATGKQGPHNQFKKTLGPWAVGQRAAHDIYLGPQPGLAGLETCSLIHSDRLSCLPQVSTQGQLF